MNSFYAEQLIEKMSDCEWLYFSFIFRIIFGVLSLIIIGILLLIPIALSILLFLYCEQKCSAFSSLVCNIIVYIIVFYYFDFVKRAFIKTAKFFFVLHC